LLNEQPIQRLDPRFTTNAWDVKVSRLVAPGLTTIDNPQGRLTFDLAEDVVRESETSYRARLRADARFPDGRPVDAEDVRYTFDSVRDPLLGASMRQTWDGILDHVEVLGPREVRFRLKRPRATFVTDLSFGIVDRRAAAPLDQAVRAAAAAHLRPPPYDPAREPPGAGAFRVEAREGDRVVLARNPYARVAPREARFVVRTIRDPNSRFLALLGGSADLIQNGLPPLVAETFERDPRLSLTYGPSAIMTYVGFNTAAEGTRDPRVREAIACAINRPLIIASKLRGHAALATSFLPPASPFAPADATGWTYDPARARRLLDEAGYPDPDGDGPLPRLRLTWKTSADRYRTSLVYVLAAQLGEVGIAVDVRPFEFATFVADVSQGNFQLFSLQSPELTEPDTLLALFHSSRIPGEGTRGALLLNRFRYRNPTVDAQLAEATATSEPVRRRALYADVQRALRADLPMLPLWFEDNVVAARRGVAGYEITPTASLAGAVTASKR
jgi:peptide/nickel transport system substrate-binding protein